MNKGQLIRPTPWVPIDTGRRQLEEIEITSLGQLQHLSHKVRGRILLNVLNGASVADVTLALGMKPTSLYRHFTVLVDAGMIFVGETRMVGLTIESKYFTVARRMTMSTHLLSNATDPATAIATESAFFDLAKHSFIRSRELGLVQPLSPNHTALLDNFRMNLTIEERRELVADLLATLRKYGSRTTPGAAPFEVFVSGQPVQRSPLRNADGTLRSD